MRDHRPTSTNELFENSGLSSLQKHATQLHLINEKVLQLIAPALAPFVRVANLKQGLLSLEVASAAIKTKLNYDRLTLINQLRSQGFPGLIGIDITINPDIYILKTDNKKQVTKNPRVLTTQSADMLNMVAQQASPKLKARLESLAKLANKEKENNS